ncbi:MAG: HAD family hydrolase [Rhodobacteraceae bacterium]|nr:HAD family hydrolase [Paracoccaceae bacterium]
MPKAVIFDCDGVLVDSEVIYGALEREHLAEIGLDYDDLTYRRRFTGLNDPDFYQALQKDFALLDKGPFPETFRSNLKSATQRRLDEELHTIEGIETLLDTLTCPVAVASSSSPDSLRKKLTQTHLIDWFGSHLYSGEDVENGKPAPDLFLMTAAELGVAPADCVVVEDSVNGVKAGVAAGMQVWGFTGGGHADADLGQRLSANGAALVFASFEKMQAHVKGL